MPIVYFASTSKPQKRNKQQSMAPVLQRTKSQQHELKKELASEDFLPPNHPLFCHGRIFSVSDADKVLIPPNVTWESPDRPREDHRHDCMGWLTASEYTDTDNILNLKIEKLSELLLNSKKTVVYSGAGISVSAGIGQAARGSHKKHPIFGKVNPLSATPTITHHALAALATEHDLIHGWIQQNHDGLPQKAGFPQARINEIHGSWYDPSNPVVVYSGQLRAHEFSWMEREAETADLVLVLGTSLSGLNADQVAIDAAYRSLKKRALGMVLINLQQTPHDGKASLRIFGSSDDVMRRLFHHMNIRMSRMKPILFWFPSRREFSVPYDSHGQLIPDLTKSMMRWNLAVGASIQIVNHNVVGAGQPSHKAMLGKNPGLVGQIIGWDDASLAIKIGISDKIFLLGYWWIDTAIHGRTPTIPVVNLHPDLVYDNK